jgi:2-desacetyl-2-hydroxyethyl bacteriochlorophyllide A dehydrogenase
MHVQQVIISGEKIVSLQQSNLDPALQPHELLVETEYSFVSAGTELAIYTGTESVYMPGSWCEYPCVPGYSNVGRILAKGAAVSQFEVGERIYTDAKHTSHFKYNLADSKYRNLAVKVPEDLPGDLVCCFHMLHVAKAALDVATTPYGRWVAVFGLGMVGNLAAQLFKIAGAHVIGIDPSPQRRELAKQCGILAVDTGDTLFADLATITHSEGVMTSVEAVGHSQVVLQALKATMPYGEVILLGSPRVEVQGNLTEVFSEIHLKWKTLKGALEWHIPTYSDQPTDRTRYGNHQLFYTWLRQGNIRLEPLISHRLPAQAIKQAYDGLLEHKDSYTGVVLKWS